MESTVEFCGRCGAPRQSLQDRFCRSCGTLFDGLEPGAAPPAFRSVTLSRRQRPVWVTCVLTLATFNLYFLWWLGATWAEMKRERRDPTMHPFWHAVASIVPIYGYFKIHAHFETLKELLAARGLGSVAMEPDTAVGLSILENMCWIAQPVASTVSTPLEYLLVACGSALPTVIVGRGQASLNAYWRGVAADSAAARERIHWAEWVGLVVLGLLWLLVLLGLASGGGSSR